MGVSDGLKVAVDSGCYAVAHVDSGDAEALMSRKRVLVDLSSLLWTARTAREVALFDCASDSDR